MSWRPPELLWERYELLRPLHAGRAPVWLARDRVRDDQVVLKWLLYLGSESRRRVHRELAAHRWLDLPAVVSLRDEGQHEGHYVLVTDYVEGSPVLEPGSEQSLEELLPELLRSVLAVHRHGLVHGDLKPDNLRWTGERVVLLDLGLARVGKLQSGATGGTPGYAAPELYEGADPDQLSEVYSLGAMLAWWHLGRGPQEGEEPDASLLPEALRDLLGPREARPGLEELALRVGLRRGPPFELVDLDSPEACAQLIEGPEPFLHVPSDGGAELYFRTQGRAERMLEELSAWESRGLGEWTETGFALDHRALAALKLGDLARPGEPEEVLARAEAAWPGLIGGGRLRLAGKLAAMALSEARLLDEVERVLRWAERRLEAALYSEADLEIQAAQAELLALSVDARLAPQVGPLVELAAGTHALLARRDLGRAEELLEDLEGELCEPLEVLRMGALANAWMNQDAEGSAERILELDRWAEGDALRQGKLLGWLSVLAYKRGDYLGASALAEQAAKRRQEAGAPVDSVSSVLVWAAYSALDGRDFDGAVRLADKVASSSARLRHPRIEAMAVWTSRSARLRTRSDVSVDEDELTAASVLGRRVHRHFLLLAVATSLRGHQFATCAERASVAAELFASWQEPLLRDLCRAVAQAMGGHLETTMGSIPPGPLGLRAQLAALRAVSRPAPKHERELVEQWIAVSPDVHSRSEFLSPVEALAILRTEDSAPIPLFLREQRIAH